MRRGEVTGDIEAESERIVKVLKFWLVRGAENTSEDLVSARKAHMELDKEVGQDPTPDDIPDNLEELGLHMSLSLMAAAPGSEGPHATSSRPSDPEVPRGFEEDLDARLIDAVGLGGLVDDVIGRKAKAKAKVAGKTKAKSKKAAVATRPTSTSSSSTSSTSSSSSSGSSS